MYAYVFAGKVIFADEPSSFYRGTSLFWLFSFYDGDATGGADGDCDLGFSGVEWRFHGEFSFARELCDYCGSHCREVAGSSSYCFVYSLALSDIVSYAFSLS